jgi:hypothetical protein
MARAARPRQPFTVYYLLVAPDGAYDFSYYPSVLYKRN